MIKLYFLFFVLFSFTIYSQETMVSYLEISKKPTYNNEPPLSVNDFLITEAKVPSIKLDSLNKNIIKLSSNINEMIVYKNCESYYSNQARLSCLNNHVFKDIFQLLEYPKQNLPDLAFGSVIFNFVIDEKGNTIPFSLSYNSISLKNSVLLAINKWFEKIKDFKSIPAKIQNVPKGFASQVIFSYLLEDTKAKKSDLDKTKLDSDVLLNTQLKKEEIVEIKNTTNVNLIDVD
ncbi:MAG: hypothetical protein ACEQSF_04560 [Solirubrobacteraceae bacterium]